MKYILISLAVFLWACQAQTTAKPVSDTGAYMIVSGKNYAAKDLAPYVASLPPIYKQYGGRYVALSSSYDLMEGQSDAQAIIISAWPDVETAKAFWLSSEYAEAKKLREGIGEFDVVILPALPTP